MGRDVAQASAAGGEIRLGGEVRSVGVLFIDLVGSKASEEGLSWLGSSSS